MALTVNAGGIFRASQFNALVPLTVTRPSDFSVIVTTLADDAFLFFTNLPASATFEMTALLFVKGSTGGDFKAHFTCSGVGATLDWSQGAFNTGGAVDDHTPFALADSCGIGTLSPTTTPQAAPLWGKLTTGTGSSIRFGLQWSQWALDGVNGTSLLAQSWLTLKRTA